MNKVSFESDYNNGAHPEVLRRIVETNASSSQSYGLDEWSQQAREKIRIACASPNADVFFLIGGTQANATVIDALLPRFGAVVAVETAHINVHESGAIEGTGHKVITLPSHEGRMEASELDAYLQRFFADPTWQHMAVPHLVYLTFPTELGTIYSRQQLEAISDVCRRYSLRLFIDGARLGYGLMADACDVTLPWLSSHTDAFYIGGTKVGALCGEAVVFPHGAPTGFFTHVKAHGALMAKSRLAGVQFLALFTDDLYLRISHHAVFMAMRLRQIFLDAGFPLRPSPTNQQFVVLPDDLLPRLLSRVLFETWEPLAGHQTLCRFVTSWATTDSDLQTLREALNQV